MASFGGNTYERENSGGNLRPQGVAVVFAAVLVAALGLVPHNQSEILYQALQKAGVRAQFHTVAGGGHGGFKDPAIEKMVVDFFEKQLKSAQQAH